MALRQQMRESSQWASRFRWMESHDEADVAMAMMAAAQDARITR